MKPYTLNWYVQSLCYQNRDNVTMLNSWMASQHAFPVIGLAYCQNTTENNNWCKTQEQTDEWLLRQRLYFIYQDTRVQSNIWKDHPVVDEHPYFGDQ